MVSGDDLGHQRRVEDQVAGGSSSDEEPVASKMHQRWGRALATRMQLKVGLAAALPTLPRSRRCCRNRTDPSLRTSLRLALLGGAPVQVVCQGRQILPRPLRGRDKSLHFQPPLPNSLRELRSGHMVDLRECALVYVVVEVGPFRGGTELVKAHGAVGRHYPPQDSVGVRVIAYRPATDIMQPGSEPPTLGWTTLHHRGEYSGAGNMRPRALPPDAMGMGTS
mmetsp:Transcript_21844/g.48270  ORF Transcript_21844/g.48270 Transcript_21844/m.48270 type:complete len:222 (+) Transcript_21844:244-909(+)